MVKKQSSSSKIINRTQLIDKCREWKEHAKQVVFTNGCFDIVHLGHVDYLEKAAALGDVLVVALNTDASVSRLKGPSRPVIAESSRARLVAALGFVDAVVLFDEATPLELIQALSPDVLVKGDDYQLSNIVGADDVIAKGGKVMTIPLVKGYSTSSIVDKIKNEHL
jgi:D-glycero-beta-D-manno-heptose 1-phosphate adenylyltransferase